MTNIKKPSVEGLEKVKKDLNKARKKKPSEDLKKIIEEIGEESEESKDDNSIDKVAINNDEQNRNELGV